MDFTVPSVLFFLLQMGAALSVNPSNENFTPLYMSGNLSTWLNASVNSTQTVTYSFSYDPRALNDTAIRVLSTNTSHSSNSNPVIMVVRRAMTVQSWTIPEQLQGSYFYTVSRTLCPLQEAYEVAMPEARFYIDISTSSIATITVKFMAYKVYNFTLRQSRTYKFQVNPSSPMFHQYNFMPGDHDEVLVKVTSEDEICAVVSVQEFSCPVRVLPSNVKYRGRFQTMMKKSALTIKKEDLFADGSFFVVVVVLPKNTACYEGVSDMLASSVSSSLGEDDATSNAINRQKNISVVIEKALRVKDYDRGIGLSIGVCLGFYVLTFFSIWICWYMEQRIPGALHESFMRRLNGGAPVHGRRRSEEYNESGRDTPLVISSDTIPNYQATATGSSPIQDASDGEEMSILTISQLMRRKQQTGENIVVTDLSQEDRKLTSQKYRQYAWTMLTVALFYALPAVQLVIAYQKELNKNGDEDLCYYNFLCAHPAGVLSDFNHVWSNIGYGFLGILFFLIAFRRSRVYYSRLAQMDGVGIPQYFGLYYAMAIALFVEGVMSGTYHICPNKANFQFDTSFMYIIAGMCMLKLYQSRHPDIEASAYRAFFALAVIILVALFGVLYNSQAFWAFFFVSYMIVILCINVEIYYMGRWSFVSEFFTKFFKNWRHDSLKVLRDLCCTGAKPHYQSRWWLLVLATLINVAIGIWGIASLYPDFASYFLIIMISNLGIYFVYYFIMKLFVAHEMLSTVTWITAGLMVLCWIPALYFFTQGLTNWQKTPAESRDGNENCIVVDFFDSHDVWHFLSAFGVFFSFVTIMTVDDNTMNRSRDSILVF